MQKKLRSLVVDLLVVHDIPQKYSANYLNNNPDVNGERIILSEVPTKFDDTLERFFRDKIVSTIGSPSSFEIEFEENDSVVKTVLKRYFDSENPHIEEQKCIKLTQEIAKELDRVQNAKNSGGILLFIPCHFGDVYGMAILKVEREEGVRLLKSSTESGKTTFDVEHIRDLMLTEKTKLFKISLFYSENNVIKGYLCDMQQSRYKKYGVANFFLVDFLGCKLKDDPDVTTNNFYIESSKFINKSNMDPVKKIQAHQHLISELSNNYRQVDVPDFAQKYFDRNYVQEFIQVMDDNEIPKTFVKEISLIEKKISMTRYLFNSGIVVITGNPDTIKDTMCVESMEDGKVRVEILDYLKKVE